MTWKNAAGMVALMLAMTTAVVVAQTPAPKFSGSVTSISDTGLAVSNGLGQDIQVMLGGATKMLQIPPGSKDLASATPATAADLVVGDKVLVTGTQGDDPKTLHAQRVIVMKSADIAASHAAEAAAWQKGAGGLVKSVDTTGNNIVVSSAAKTLTVQVTPATKFSRYSGESVRFEDAVGSTFADVKAGDQLRVRGTKSDDGDSIKADAIVTGSFRNFSGLLTAIDNAAGTVTLKDLATKKLVTVKVSGKSDVRRLPAQAAARFAARAAGTPVGPMGTAPGSSGAMASGPGGNARAGMDLSQMLSRLPTETLGGLKVGDAVMIVATLPPADAAQPSAVTLLAGVEPILQASPKGEMTLTPWSMGSGAEAAGGGGGQ